MTRITYWQCAFPLATAGVIAEAASLPQDQVTAAVVVAALIARHPDPWPGAYTALVDDGDGEPFVVDPDDPRVKLARQVLASFGPDYIHNAPELAKTRHAILQADVAAH